MLFVDARERDVAIAQLAGTEVYSKVVDREVEGKRRERILVRSQQPTTPSGRREEGYAHAGIYDS